VPEAEADKVAMIAASMNEAIAPNSLTEPIVENATRKYGHGGPVRAPP
jgi:hypothetical protein